MKRAASFARELKMHTLVQRFVEGGRLLKETSTKNVNETMDYSPGVLAKNGIFYFRKQGYHWKGHFKRSRMVQISAS